MTAYTLEQAENEIRATYEFFARESPGTVVQEVGHLSNLWAIVDAKYMEHAKTLTHAECVKEYGNMTAMEREF